MSLSPLIGSVNHETSSAANSNCLISNPCVILRMTSTAANFALSLANALADGAREGGLKF